MRLAAWFTWARRVRRTRFAEANGYVYDEPADDVGGRYPGTAFSVGSSRSRDESFRTVDPPFVEFGRYQWTVGSGKSRRTYRIGFAAMRIERPLPHMVLDARGNNGIFGAGIIPFSFDRDQVLSLEGDFDRFFTLYCPADYERDALYVFTPDVMALLIDEAALLDVEIVDDWVFLYSTTPFDLDDPSTWRRLHRIDDTLVAKLRRVAGRYRDDRVAGQDAVVLETLSPSSPTSQPSPARRRYVVGQEGRRLRRSPPWLAVAVVGVLAAFWIAAQILR